MQKKSKAAKTHKNTTKAPAINTQKEQKTQKEQNMQKEKINKNFTCTISTSYLSMKSCPKMAKIQLSRLDKYRVMNLSGINFEVIPDTEM